MGEIWIMKHLILFLIMSISLLGQKYPEIVVGTYKLHSRSFGEDIIIITTDGTMVKFKLEGIVNYLHTISSIRNKSSAKYYIEELLNDGYSLSNVYSYTIEDDHTRWTATFAYKAINEVDYESHSVSVYAYYDGGVQVRNHHRNGMTSGAIRKSPFNDDGRYNNFDEVCSAFAEWYVKVYVE